jgi:hypothetical protein
VVTKGFGAALRLVGGSILICAIIAFFFSPRFVIWRGLHIPEAWVNPEVNRAVNALEQLQDPLGPIDNPSNQVIRWRLFFPLLARALHLPPLWYLALPHLGCVVAVAYTVRLIQRRGGPASLAWVAAASIACADWLFVSLGWLAYFDSWSVLGLLVATFSPSRFALVAAGLIEPWIDERFVLALPLCLMTRTMVNWESQEGRSRAWLTDASIMVAVTMPYVVARLSLLASSDTGSMYYLQDTIRELRTVPLRRLIHGLWNGFRAAWLYLLVVGVWSARTQRGWLRLVPPVAFGIQAALAVIIAGDISRNSAMLMPAVTFGALLLCVKYQAAARIAVPAVFAANLLLPAAHVVYGFELPVRSFRQELAAWREPPNVVNAAFYVLQGRLLISLRRLPLARHNFDNAIQLDPRDADAYFGRGMAGLEAQQFASAEADFDMALQLRPGWPDAQCFRGLARAGAGAREDAVRDLEMALQGAGADWAYRLMCATNLEQLKAR